MLKSFFVLVADRVQNYEEIMCVLIQTALTHSTRFSFPTDDAGNSKSEKL